MTFPAYDFKIVGSRGNADVISEKSSDWLIVRRFGEPDWLVDWLVDFIGGLGDRFRDFLLTTVFQVIFKVQSWIESLVLKMIFD